MEDNFLTGSKPTREGAPLDSLFVNREGLVGHVTVGGHGHSDHRMTEFSVCGLVVRGASRTGSPAARLWPV